MRVGALVLLCAVGCGRIGFDPPIEGTWAYGTPRAIYLYNDVAPSKTIAIAENSPVAVEGDAHYAVTPDLTGDTGLTLDPVTGVISGRPTRTSPPTDYVVTATTTNERRATIVSIRTAPGFYVDDLGDADDRDAADDDCVTAGGRCSLRGALGQLAAFDATPRVALIPAGTILLGGTELVVVQPAELIGAGRDETVIDAADASRVLELGDDNTVIIGDLTVRRGSADAGGCISALGGTLTMRDVAVRSCTSSGNGGGVHLWDDFGTRKVVGTLERVTFDQNRATGPQTSGGGLLVSTGAPDSSAMITGCTFSNNTATNYGAALAHISGPITIAESLFEGNAGGSALGFQNGTDVMLVNSTIIDNHGVGGSPGGVYTNNFTTIRLVNDTISGNTCAGGCYGGGIHQNSGGVLTMRNTILTDNVDLDASTLSNCAGAGTLTSLGHNLTDSPDNGLCLAAALGDLFATDPRLEPLADHGGPTRTTAIGASSPAYNAATNCPATDQRGPGFPRPTGTGTCDIGAFEVQ